MPTIKVQFLFDADKSANDTLTEYDGTYKIVCGWRRIGCESPGVLLIDDELLKTVDCALQITAAIQQRPDGVF